MKPIDCIMEVLSRAEGRPLRNVGVDIIGLLTFHGFTICKDGEPVPLPPLGEQPCP